jgi:hypothetical protein
MGGSHGRKSGEFQSGRIDNRENSRLSIMTRPALRKPWKMGINCSGYFGLFDLAAVSALLVRLISMA